MDRKRLLKRDYKVLEFEAAILYVKHGLSAQAISEKLNLSMPTIQKWNEAGRWKELRPDMNVLNEYRAAKLFVQDGLSADQIAEKLNISKNQIEVWIHVNGWKAAKLVLISQSVVPSVVEGFCRHFIGLFPGDRAKVEMTQNDFIKKITAKN